MMFNNFYLYEVYLKINLTKRLLKVNRNYSYGTLFLAILPPPSLSNSFVDYRTSTGEGEPFLDLVNPVVFSYQNYVRRKGLQGGEDFKEGWVARRLGLQGGGCKEGRVTREG